MHREDCFVTELTDPVLLLIMAKLSSGPIREVPKNVSLNHRDDNINLVSIVQ